MSEVKQLKKGLAAEIGRRVRALREAYDWTQETAAIHLGIERAFLSKIETGAALPPPELQARLVGLFYRGKTWKNAPRLQTPGAIAKADNWQRIKVRTSPALYKKLCAFARDTGYTREAVVTIALSRLLEGGLGNLTATKMAIEAVEQARVADLLQRQPYLVGLLEADIELARQIGAKVELEPIEGVRDQYQAYGNAYFHPRVLRPTADPVEIAPWIRKLEKI